jgi:hypothetical protein
VGKITAQDRCKICRNILVEVAKARRKITYGDLAKLLGVRNQSLGRYLDPIYYEEIRAGRPDLTLVVVYADTGFGRFNSRGEAARSVKVDPHNPDHVKGYKRELARVYKQWAGKGLWWRFWK